MMGQFYAGIQANLLTKLMALVAMPVLKAKRRLDPRRYNGASLLGCVVSW